jgi:polyhydroxyalkanoate synthesis regulator phasin
MSKLFEKFLDYKMSDEAKGKIGDLADKASEVKTELKSDFKGVREGNLRRKANKILANAESEGRAVSAQEQDRLKDLKSKAMSAEARQGKRDERYAESKARTDLKRQSYVNKMVKKGIMTAEQAKGRFDNIKGITANSAKLVNKLSNQETKPAEIEDNSSKIASNSETTPEELLGYSQVNTNNKIGEGFMDNIGIA